MDSLPFEIYVDIISFVFASKPNWKNLLPLLTVNRFFNQAIRFISTKKFSIQIPQKMVLVHLSADKVSRRPLRKIWVDVNLQLYQFVRIALGFLNLEKINLRCNIILKHTNEEFCFFDKPLKDIPSVTFIQYFNINPNSQGPIGIEKRYLRKLLDKSISVEYVHHLETSTVLTACRPTLYLFLRNQQN